MRVHSEEFRHPSQKKPPKPLNPKTLTPKPQSPEGPKLKPESPKPGQELGARSEVPGWSTGPHELWASKFECSQRLQYPLVKE